MKLGSFCENWNAASLALSIKGAEGLSEGVGPESAEPDSACGGSGQGGRAGCVPRFKVGGSSEQGGVLCACNWVGDGAGSLSLAEADESAALADVATKASTKATPAPARRSRRPVCRRLHPFTESPSLESSTIRRAAGRPGLGTISTRKSKGRVPPVQPLAKSKGSAGVSVIIATIRLYGRKSPLKAENRDNTVSFQNLQLHWRRTLASCNVMVHLHLGGTISLTHGPHRLDVTTPKVWPSRQRQTRPPTMWKRRAVE